MAAVTATAVVTVTAATEAIRLCQPVGEGAFGSSAAPAFAGWQVTPTTPGPGQLAQAAQACGQDLGSPVLTDSRGPYTAAIYATSAGQIQIDGGGTRASAGNALTLVTRPWSACG
jgi:hypothetical protein